MSEPAGPAGLAADRARRRARELFLDDGTTHGCAESALLALKEAFGLSDPGDASPAMALNGGIAWSGATCGALTGAALAVGQLAAARIDDHRDAKRAARELVAGALDALEAAEGATTCREPTGLDLRAPGVHAAFIAGGAWRDGCMRRIELVVGRLAGLADDAAWEAATRRT